MLQNKLLVFCCPFFRTFKESTRCIRNVSFQGRENQPLMPRSRKRQLLPWATQWITAIQMAEREGKLQTREKQVLPVTKTAYSLMETVPRNPPFFQFSLILFRHFRVPQRL